MFKLNFGEPESNYLSEDVTVKLVEIPVHFMDNRTMKENDIVMFFAMPQDATKEDMYGGAKSICSAMGFTYMGCGEPLIRDHRFDAMEAFMRS